MISEYLKIWRPELTEETLEAFDAYWAILLETNETMNLTRITEEKEAATRHFCDSLAAAQFLPDHAKCIDIGTGAGFPGMALAIARRDIRMTLLDSSHKKCLFLEKIARQLSVDVEILPNRAEEAARISTLRESFDVAMARAVAAMPTLVELMLPFVKIGGEVICQKSKNAEDELKSASRALAILGGRASASVPYTIPEYDFSGVFFRIEKVRQTPEKYPRRPGTPSKEPL